MRRLFVPPEAVSENRIIVTGDDVKHVRDVLRMHSGDEVTITCGRGVDYRCGIISIEDDHILLDIKDEASDTSELPVRLMLFQALPKSDKMDSIVQKSVELGASDIIPMRTVRSVVRLDDQKAEKKVVRWQRIAEEAAKQSGRGIVPRVYDVMDYDKAVDMAADTGGHILIPYELCEESSPMGVIRDAIAGVMAERDGVRSSGDGSDNMPEPDKGWRAKECISIFIGSEGGFERSEVDQVLDRGGRMMSLGHRILRTETAGPAVLAVIMMMIEDKIQ